WEAVDVLLDQRHRVRALLEGLTLPDRQPRRRRGAPGKQREGEGEGAELGEGSRARHVLGLPRGRAAGVTLLFFWEVHQQKNDKNKNVFKCSYLSSSPQSMSKWYSSSRAPRDSYSRIAGSSPRSAWTKMTQAPRRRAIGWSARMRLVATPRRRCASATARS